MNMFDYYRKTVFENYANFKGRARAREYWYFALLNISFAFVFYFVDNLLGINFEQNSGGLFYTLFLLGTIIPGFAVAVRRMHDIGKSGLSLFLFFVPFIGMIWVLILLCTTGTRGGNKYGADPKDRYKEINDIGIE
jgi:uncharacterized membrane protein YhaH (DUF805 family)